MTTSRAHQRHHVIAIGLLVAAAAVLVIAMTTTSDALWGISVVLMLAGIAWEFRSARK